MQNKSKGMNLLLTAAIMLTFGLAHHAQSTDIDQPTVLTSNVVEGEGDGKAETFYYTFTATKGDLKVTLDAKTDYYSVIMDAALTDEDGKELLKMSAVANDTGKREVMTKHFVRETKVILRVRLPKDEHVKLLTYRIKLEGAIKIDPPATPAEITTATPVAASPSAPDAAAATIPATATATASPTSAADASTGAQPATQSTLKEKAKAKAKEQAKKILTKIID